MKTGRNIFYLVMGIWVVAEDGPDINDQSRHRTPCWYRQVKTWGRIIGCKVVRSSLSCIARKSSPKKYHRRFCPSHPLLRVLESTHSLRIFYGIGYEDRPRVAWRESWSAFQRGFGINSICLLERTRPGKYSCINWGDPCSTLLVEEDLRL